MSPRSRAANRRNLRQRSPTGPSARRGAPGTVTGRGATGRSRIDARSPPQPGRVVRLEPFLPGEAHAWHFRGSRRRARCAWADRGLPKGACTNSSPPPSSTAGSGRASAAGCERVRGRRNTAPRRTAEPAAIPVQIDRMDLKAASLAAPFGEREQRARDIGQGDVEPAAANTSVGTDAEP